MQEGLITLQQARGAGPCADGWTKFLKALGEPAEFNPDRLFSIGDVAVSNGLDDALWCLRLLPPRLAVQAVMPAVKRASVHTTDARVHETIQAIERWIDGDTTVDLRTARAVAEQAWRKALASSAAAEAPAHAAVRMATQFAFSSEVNSRPVPWAAGIALHAAIAAARTRSALARVEREAQLQDILSRLPPHALA